MTLTFSQLERHGCILDEVSQWQTKHIIPTFQVVCELFHIRDLVNSSTKSFSMITFIRVRLRIETRLLIVCKAMWHSFIHQTGKGN